MYILEELKIVYERRELLSQMINREVKARYKQSILGYFWVILNPLAQMLVLSFVFSVIVRIPTSSTANIPYSVFLFTALLPWNLFSTSLSTAANSLVKASTLITKIYFPRTILVIASIFSKFIDFFFSLSILIIYFLIYQIPITTNILWVIPIFIIQQMFTVGLALFLAAANLIYRDVQYLLNLVLVLWMYATPIIYPMDIVPYQYKIIFQLNPMAVLINAYRQVVLGGESPNLVSLTIALALSTLTLQIGLSYFKSSEKVFADNI